MNQTPRVARILETAERRAADFGHDYLGTEHLLLALLDKRGGVASAAIEEFTDLDDLRSKVVEIVQSEAYSTHSALPDEE